jgi:hypothetical protein
MTPSFVFVSWEFPTGPTADPQWMKLMLAGWCAVGTEVGISLVREARLGVGPGYLEHP